MGFFDKILKGLGFEDEENKETTPKKVKLKEKNKKQKAKTLSASFDLKQTDEPKQINEKLLNVNNEEEKQEEVISQSSPASLNIVKVHNQVEVQNVIDQVKRGEQVIINMSALTGQDFTRSLDFLTGAIYALNKSMQKVETAIFIIQ